MVRETRTVDGKKYIVEHIIDPEADNPVIMKVYDKYEKLIFSIDGDFDTITENELIKYYETNQ